MSGTGNGAKFGRLVSLLVVLGLGFGPSTAQAGQPITTEGPVPSCLKRVAFELVDARTTGCLVTTAAGQWQSTDLVTLNGIPLPLVAGTKLVLSGPSTAAPGGKISVNADITLLGVTFSQGLISRDLPAGNLGEEKDFYVVSPANQKLLGFSVGGNVAIRLGKDATGTGVSRFVMVLKLPDIFRNGPNANAGGLTGTVAIGADFTGVKTDALKLQIANAYVGQVELKNLCLSYTATGSTTEPCMPPAFGATPLLECTQGTDQTRWDGAALVTLPTVSRPELGVFAGVRGGQFSYGGAQVANLGNSLPIASGVYLDKFGLGLCINPPPFKLTGAAGIAFGPIVNNVRAANLDARLTYTDTRPWLIDARGSLALFGNNLANGYLTYRSSGAIDFGFDANLNFASGLFTTTAKAAGWYQPSGRRFDVFGRGQICAAGIVCTSGDIAVSSIGVAGCASLTVAGYPEPYWFGVRWVPVKIRAGAGYRWSTKKVALMGTSCDVGPYRATKAALISANGQPLTITIGHGLATSLRFQGRGAPPTFVLTGPGGRPRIVVDKAGEFKLNSYYYLQDADDNSTAITLAKPAGGRWTVRVSAGSVPIVGEAQAGATPDASAAGTVTGTGTSRVLHYLYESQPGQQVVVFERGDGYEHELGVAGGTASNCPRPPTIPKTPTGDIPAAPKLTCGTIAFTAADGPAGLRKIVGVVLNAGEATGEFDVASYTLHKPPPLAAPRFVRVERHSTDTVTVAWLGVAGARTYDIDVSLNDGESKLYVVDSAKRAFTVPEGISRADTVTVAISAVTHEEVRGQTARQTNRGVAGALPPAPEIPPATPS